MSQADTVSVHSGPSADRFKVTKAAKVTEKNDDQAATPAAEAEPRHSTSVDGFSTHTRQVRFGSSPNILNTLYMEEDGSVKDKSVQRLLQTFSGEDHGEDSAPREKANLGTVLGVFFPCIQNIFGVIYFVRLYWIVGEAGAIEAFLIVFSCCCVSVLTSLSISAIATNGKVHGGGTYFMISRSLGPEFGGAVGILFYLGISVSVAMYLIGSIELLLEYIAPQLRVFEDRINNFRLWGSVLLALVACAVFLGVRFVSRFALLVLSAVLISIASVYIGMFLANSDNSAKVCFLGDRLLASDPLMVNGSVMCSKDPSGPMYKLWCNKTSCDPFFDNNKAEMRAGVPGLTGGVFEENARSHYGQINTIIGQSEIGHEERGEIIRDIDSSFVILLAIYFPSITGFEQGTSYSGDLLDAQKSIPFGTLAAVVVTSIVYLSTVLLFGATVHGSVLRDKYGVSIGSQLIMSQLSWPSPWVILIGALMSTVGAGLQALTAAPRLLQAVAKDEVLGPLLRPFAYMSRRNEPIPAIALSTTIAEIGILIAKLDYVAPIVTMFFLLCYGFVNFACALQSFLNTPHWRPRFKFYHWTLALLGVALCLSLMFLSSVLYTFIALALAGMAYKYIEYKGAEKEWGDGMRGLSMAAAQVALLRLREDFSERSTKNWRPQLLVLAKLQDSGLEITREEILAFASQLKEGKGLTIVASVIVGDYFKDHEKVKEVKCNIQKSMEKHHMKGFTYAIMSDTPSRGICHVIQSAGLGALYPNTVVVAWPTHWFNCQCRKSYETFIDTLHMTHTARKALIVLKGIEGFPLNEARLSGTIDVWWIMHDGSLLIMLPFLLMQHKVWKQCQMRIFTVAQMSDNSVQIKKDLVEYMYNLRIPASVEVVEMEDKDISAYTIERTLMMEERNKLMAEMRLKRKDSVRIVDNIMDRAHPYSSTNLTKARAVSTATDAQIPVQPDQVKVVVDDDQPVAGPTKPKYNVHYTFSPEAATARKDVREAFNISDNANFGFSSATESDEDTPHKARKKTNMRKMHTAVRLNEMLREKSQNAELVVINMPSVPTNATSQTSYMEFLEVLSEGLVRVVMVKGTGREVITIYN